MKRLMIISICIICLSLNSSCFWLQKLDTQEHDILSTGDNIKNIEFLDNRPLKILIPKYIQHAATIDFGREIFSAGTMEAVYTETSRIILLLWMWTVFS